MRHMGHQALRIRNTQHTTRGHALRATLILLLIACILLPSPAWAQDPTPEPPVYVVQRGDSLSLIAQRFGTTVGAIVAANNIANPSLIVTGQRLVIPTEQPELVPGQEPVASTRLHTVTAKESLPFLAFRYGTTVEDLREANQVHRLGLVLPGQTLTIPSPVVVATYTLGFPTISAQPASVPQGRTMAIEVQHNDSLDLRGWFLGQELSFVQEDGAYWALVGVDALTPPGTYPLALTATESETGDRLTMQETFTVTDISFPTYNIPVSPDQQPLLDPAVVQAERKKVNQTFAGVSDERLWSGTFGLPLKGDLRTTAPFGQRRSYGGGPVTSYHTGHDYGADTGTPVFAPITATVALAEPLKVRGNVVILDHGLGVFTGYWHLSQIDVEPGQLVGPGKQIGLVGNTGLSTGPHLHWEMRVHGVPVHPVQWTRLVFP